MDNGSGLPAKYTQGQGKKGKGLVSARLWMEGCLITENIPLKKLKILAMMPYVD